MNDHIVEIKRECPSCEGTGLFRGRAEREGYAVVCYNCKGEGWNIFKLEYNNPPETKIQLYDVHTVLETNPGIVCGGHPSKDLPSFGGMLYVDWIKGKPFSPGSEMRNYVCPVWWFQSTNSNKKPRWPRCNSMLGNLFSKCEYFSNKEMCWEQWDKESEGS